MPRKQKKYHFIYKTTCLITGKFYVGMHSADNLEDGYLGSGKILGYSICRHGRENHVREILEFCSSREELKQREKEMVNEELLSQPLNINLKYGGDGGWDHIGEDAIKKRKISASKALKGKSFSNKHKKAISLAMVGNSNFKATWGRKKLPLSDEHREKIKKTFLERGHSRGEKNSQFGSCWVTDGVKPIKIKKEHLDEYIQNGYSRGRKIMDVLF